MSDKLTETVERAVMSCPQCEGEGGYPDGLDADACWTECTRCGSNGWIVNVAALSRPNVDEAEELRFWLRKAGEVLALHSADAPGTPTRDALVFVNAGLNHHARAKVRAALRGSADNGGQAEAQQK